MCSAFAAHVAHHFVVCARSHALTTAYVHLFRSFNPQFALTTVQKEKLQHEITVAAHSEHMDVAAIEAQIVALEEKSLALKQKLNAAAAAAPKAPSQAEEEAEEALPTPEKGGCCVVA